MLSVHAVEVRYPGTDTELEDAREAIHNAEIVERWVLSCLATDDMGGDS